MLFEGLRLLVVGMSTVFAFLGILVVAMQGSAAWFRYIGDALPLPPSTPAPARADDEAEIAVILAAIAAHREATQ